MTTLPSFPVGAHLQLRGATWRVLRSTPIAGPHKDQLLHLVGTSGFLRGRRATFITAYEDRASLKLLRPEDTTLVLDPSPQHKHALVFLEAMLRRTTPPASQRLWIGHRAALDLLPYQRDPAARALAQPRARLLIADAVGLGKTLEAAILTSELVVRAKAQRVLVVSTRAMMGQLQKEFWTRFSLGLVRLDSDALQDLREVLPTHKNPFQHFDRAIVSIDTLKNPAYIRHLQHARWDLILIDEAHNVATRSRDASQRARLAKLLASRSDALLLLSATPHDGTPASFLSLLRMLDPACAPQDNLHDPSLREEVQRLCVRRFKKDVASQLKEAMPEREIRAVQALASPQEERAFAALRDLPLSDSKRAGQPLLRTTLEKSLLSSPQACLSTLHNRLRELAKRPTPHPDVPHLEALQRLVADISPDAFSRYQALLRTLREDGWSPKLPHDRLVIFTERVETLRFLEQHLKADLRLKDDQVASLFGELNDAQQLRIVEQFGLDKAPVRVLLATDLASEGINLHHQAHRLIHFDIPWSLLVFQQRNGRIDRYGQKHTPLLRYLVTSSDDPSSRVAADHRILQRLIHKDIQVQNQLGDPASLSHALTQAQEEALTAQEFEQDLPLETPEATLSEDEGDLLALFAAYEEEDARREDGAPMTPQTDELPSLYEDDRAFLLDAAQTLGVEHRVEGPRTVALVCDDELQRRLAKHVPQEALSDRRILTLCDDPKHIQREIERARNIGHVWPDAHYLWRLHPVFEWVADKSLASFGPHHAPLVFLRPELAPSPLCFAFVAMLPNLHGHLALHQWVVVSLRNPDDPDVLDFDAFRRDVQLKPNHHPSPNLSEASSKELLADAKKKLPNALRAAKIHLDAQRQALQRTLYAQRKDTLDALRARHVAAALARPKEQGLRSSLQAIEDWIEQDLTLSSDPIHLQVAAAFVPLP